MTSKLRHKWVSIDIKMRKSILTKQMHCHRIFRAHEQRAA